MAKRSILGEDETPDVDLAPMIDCVFLLLIFFLVTTAFVDERGIQVNKPDVAATHSFDQKENVVLEVREDGSILFDGQPIRLAEVPRRVKASLVDPDTPVVIRAHEKTKQGAFVSVWDAAKRGGAQTLSFTTVD